MTDPTLQHRRDLQRQIFLPVFGTFGLLILGAIILLVLTQTGGVSAQQISVAAGILLTVFILFPLSLLMLVLAALLILVAYASGSLYNVVKSPLRTVQDYTAQGAALTHKTADRITEPVINARVAVTKRRIILAKLLDLPEGEETTHE